MYNVVYVICCIADPEGIANAQKSLGVGQKENVCRVRWRREKGRVRKGGVWKAVEDLFF